MGKGRDIIFYALAYILGDLLWQSLLSFWCTGAFIILTLLLATSVVFCTGILQRGAVSVKAASLLSVFCLLGAFGAVAGGIQRDGIALFEKAAELKTVISGMLDGLFPEGSTDETAIAKALVIGDKTMIGQALKNEYKASGAMHLLALSGLHVGVVYAFLNAILSIIGNGRAARNSRRFVILASLWAFALISGLSSSICRAVTMITVHEICGVLRSDRNMLRSLAISALLICLFDPDAPYAIGFQLSFIAVAGIYFIYPRIKALLKYRSRILGYIWNTVALSISCQAATAPLSYLYFGTFPRYFLVTNLVAIPLSSLAMWLMPITIAARNIPLIGMPGSKILLGTLQTLNRVISIIASL